jgi:tetratricopeptide (TPR) repeat protein
MAKQQKRRLEKGPAPAVAQEKKPESPVVICVLLGIVTCFAYFAAARNGFVDYDDGDYVSANPHVAAGLTPSSVVWAFTTGFASNWHPLTWLSHMLDYQAFGRDPAEQHLVNLALHVANTVLLFLVLRRMTGAHWRSALVAALFGLHPLHVESVAWLSERKDVLSTLFLLLTMGAYARYAQGGMRSGGQKTAPKVFGDSPESLRGAGQPRKPSGCRTEGGGQTPQRFNVLTLQRFNASTLAYLLALGFFALGLMSKPMLVTVPFLLLLLDYWPLGRFHLGDQKLNFAGALPLLVEKLPFFALTVVSSAITFLVQRKGGAVSTALTLGQRVANALVSYVRYLGKMIWPENLAVLYPHPGNWPAWEVIASAIILAALFALVIRVGRARPYMAVGWLWYFGGLVPVIGIVQVGIQSMADRYTYVPLIGIFIIIAWGSYDLATHWQWRWEALAIAATVCLGICGLLTMRQVGYWHDTETLFQRAVEVEPRNYLAYNNLGFYYANHERQSEALENYRKSLEINPDYVDSLNNMGYSLAKQGRNAEAIPYYERALRVQPNHVEVNNNLGNALSDEGKFDEAIEHYQTALKNKPDHADAHNGLGISLVNLGMAQGKKEKFDEAIPHFREAIRLKPNYASAHSNLGNALAVQQKWPEAIKEYQECLRLNPDDPQAHNNLANVLAQQGKLEEAITNYNEAIRLGPEKNPEAHFNLGMALLRQGKRDLAKAQFVEALKAKPDYVEAQKQLAALNAGGPN